MRLTFPPANAARVRRRRPVTRPTSRATLDDDVYRLSVESSGSGWTAQLDNALATGRAGETVEVPVYVTRETPAARETTVTLTATSESDPATHSVTCTVAVKDTDPRR